MRGIDALTAPLPPQQPLPAGQGSEQRERVRLRRAATMPLTLWVLMPIGQFASSGLALGGLPVAHVKLSTRGAQVTPSGRAVNRNWDPVTRQLVWVDASTGPTTRARPPR
jgi:hypothetical protein